MRGITEMGKGRTARRAARMAVAGAALAAAVTTAAPAASAEQLPGCDLGYVCAYHFNNLVVQMPPVGPGQCVTTASAYNKLVNGSDRAQRGWTQPGCTGFTVLVQPFSTMHVQGSLYSISA